MMIDTGASANIIDEDRFKELQKHHTIELNSPTKRMFAYGSDSQLTVIGQFTAKINVGQKHVQSMVYVLQSSHGVMVHS